MADPQDLSLQDSVKIILVLSWVPKTLFPDALVRQSKRTLIRVAFLLKIVCEFRGNNVFGTQDSTSMAALARSLLSISFVLLCCCPPFIEI